MYNTKIVTDFCSQANKTSSYVDIGPVWGTINESLSCAHKGGLTDLNIIDIADEQSIYTLLLYLKSKGVNNVSVFNTDVLKFREIQFDIGYCSGVLYHIPFPHDLFCAFARLINKTLILSTMSIPQDVVGGIDIVFIKNSDNQLIQRVIDYWNKNLSFKHDLTLSQNLTNLSDYSKYWNVPTEKYLRDMCNAYGFTKNIQVHRFENGCITTIIASK